MFDSKVTILSKEDVIKRYSGDLRYTHQADEAFRIIDMGKDFSIALIEDNAFFGGIGPDGEVIFRCNVALEHAFPDYNIAKFLSFIDKSEISKNRVYISCLLSK